MNPHVVHLYIFKHTIQKKYKHLIVISANNNAICISSLIIAMSHMTTVVYAAGDTSAVTKPLDNLKTLIIAVIGAVGIIILAKNVMEFAQAYQQQDSSTMNSALKGIVAGVMMAGISSVLSFLGF